MVDPARFPLGDMLPFTLEELVQSSILLDPTSEEEARAMWSDMIAEVVALRDSNAETYGLSLADGTLQALSLLSDELAERVNQYRNAGWESQYPFWQRELPAQELRRREEEYIRRNRQWDQEREWLRQAVFGPPSPQA